MRLYAFKWQVYSYKAISYRFGEPFCPLSASSRSKFYIQEPPHGSPNWLKVGLTLGTSVFLWIYVSTYSLQSCQSNLFLHEGNPKDLKMLRFQRQVHTTIFKIGHSRH